MAFDNKVTYGMNSQKATQLIVAGLIGITAMMGFAYLLRAMGIPAPDFAAQYGAILNEQVHPEAGSGMWWTGMVWHVINGAILFSFLYDYLAHRRVLPTERWTKGLVYGAGIWLMVCLIVAPMAGEGIFFRNMDNPFATAVTALLSWLVYGLVLDGMTRVRVAHKLGIAEKFQKAA